MTGKTGCTGPGTWDLSSRPNAPVDQLHDCRQKNGTWADVHSISFSHLLNEGRRPPLLHPFLGDAMSEAFMG